MELTFDNSLANTKRLSQVFANLVFNKHNSAMEIADIRRSQLKKWFAGHAIPDKEKSYISQLINGKSSFGEKAARRLEKTYKMPDKYLDNEHESLLGFDVTKLSIEDIEYLNAAMAVPSEERPVAKKIFTAFSSPKPKERTNGERDPD